MAPRKFAHATAIIPDSAIFEFLEFAQNRALAGTVKVVPVVHGGEKENGELKPAPSAGNFVSDYLLQHRQIETKKVVALAEKAGLTRNAIYAQIKKLADNRVVKRISMGLYVERNKGPAKKKEKKMVRHIGEESVGTRIVKEVAAKQNGSGEGVSLGALKVAVSKAGYKSTGVGPAVTALVSKGKLIRVGTGLYRTAPDLPDLKG